MGALEPASEPLGLVRPRRLQRIAKAVGAEIYLEVGVLRGETLLALDIPHRVGVDPSFGFDLAAQAREGLYLFQLTSDDFFRIWDGSKFDLIYLDGLHTYEQTLRDFLNSLEAAHERTVWLFDDTVPVDRYSALPDSDACHGGQIAMGRSHRMWMGEVYRVIYFIRRMMPAFSVMTFPGHGQTVVWRRPGRRPDRDLALTPDPGDMTYDRFLATGAEVLNLTPETDIYAALAADFAPRDSA